MHFHAYFKSELYSGQGFYLGEKKFDGVLYWFGDLEVKRCLDVLLKLS